MVFHNNCFDIQELETMKKITEVDVERHFGHSYVTWKIVNFCFETSREEFPISTPEFCVDGQHITKWKMTLNPKMKKGEEEAFLIILERIGTDTTPEIVFADLKYILMDLEGKECKDVRYQSKFEKNSRHEIPIWNISYIRERLKSEMYVSDTIRIWCQIIVDFEDCCRNFVGNVDVGLKTLSENLLKHYETGTDHDVILRIKGGNIPAHKALLHCRSTVLADAIEKGDKIIDLPYLDFQTMQAIVAFFYSGNMNYIARNTSILMYETALLLNISEIQEYYNPQKVELESVIDVGEHTFVWTIKNFRQLVGNCATSPVLTSEYIDVAFRISFYTKGDHTMPTHLSVFADLVKGTIPKHSCLVFSLMDNDDYLWCEGMQLSSENDKRFGFANFIKKDHFRTLIKNITGDTISIALKIEIHNDSVFLNEKYEASDSTFPVMMYYDCLSKGLTDVFLRSLFTDVTLEAGGSSFKANRFILSARSPTFHTMLKEAQDKLTVLNVKPNILRVILNYIYRGVYEDFKLEEILGVYGAAKHFALRCLKEKCLRILKENFDVQSVCAALVFSDEQQDMELKIAALNFIHGKKNCFYEDNLKILNLGKPSLYSEVMGILNGQKESDEMQVSDDI